LTQVQKTFEQLPENFQMELINFTSSLIERQSKPKQKRLRLSWAGALKKYRGQYTSLELQKKALEWWGD